jgi:DNA-directed RNA polymerase specialized sigma24 family protein
MRPCQKRAEMAVPPTDRPELLRRAAAGDREARDRLVVCVWPLFHLLAARFAGTRVARLAGLTADDLAGEAAALLLVRLPAWRPSAGSLATFAKLIALRAFLDAAGVRAIADRPFSRASVGTRLSPRDASRLPARGGDPAADPTGPPADTVARLAAAVGQLRPIQRDAVERHYGRGESFAEIAAATGTHEDTARSRAARGVAALRRELAAATANG